MTILLTSFRQQADREEKVTETLHSERGPVLHHTVWQYCQEASSTAGVEANSSTGGTEDVEQQKMDGSVLESRLI